jgi:hypothetical protein
MELKLEKVVSWFTVFTAWAYLLGWLKRYFYFQTFGIGLSSVNLSAQDYLFESWYPLESVFFFVLMLWIAVLVRRIWVRIVAAIFFVLPFLAHAAYIHYDWIIAYWFVHVNQSILKFTPFVVLLLIVVFDRQESSRLLTLSWPYDKLYFVVFVLAIFAWSVSAAKHFGGSDADSVLVCPGKYLSNVTIHVTSGAPDQLRNLELNHNLYMLYASHDSYFLLDGTNFPCVTDRRRLDLSQRNMKLYDVPRARVDWIDDSKKPNADPGALILY